MCFRFPSKRQTKTLDIPEAYPARRNVNGNLLRPQNVFRPVYVQCTFFKLITPIHMYHYATQSPLKNFNTRKRAFDATRGCATDGRNQTSSVIPAAIQSIRQVLIFIIMMYSVVCFHYAQSEYVFRHYVASVLS